MKRKKKPAEPAGVLPEPSQKMASRYVAATNFNDAVRMLEQVGYVVVREHTERRTTRFTLIAPESTTHKEES